MDIYWIREVEPWRLAFGPRPRPGDWLADEIAHWAKVGITHVVSLLEAFEAEELGLKDEAELCRRNGIEFHSFPIVDRAAPVSTREASVLLRELARLVQAGEPVYVHCRAGIGRSGLITAGVLLNLGYPFADAFKMLSFARGVEVPDTAAQIDWIGEYSKSLADVR